MSQEQKTFKSTEISTYDAPLDFVEETEHSGMLKRVKAEEILKLLGSFTITLNNGRITVEHLEPDIKDPYTLRCHARIKWTESV